MRRRDKTGGKATKTQRPKTLKRRNAPKVQVVAVPRYRQGNECRAARPASANEALEQQTATSDVLRVISSSPSELKPVFNAILANAVRICEAKFGTLYLREGDGFARSRHKMHQLHMPKIAQNAILCGHHRQSALGQVLKTQRVLSRLPILQR